MSGAYADGLNGCLLGCQSVESLCGSVHVSMLGAYVSNQHVMHSRFGTLATGAMEQDVDCFVPSTTC